MSGYLSRYEARYFSSMRSIILPVNSKIQGEFTTQLKLLFAPLHLTLINDLISSTHSRNNYSTNNYSISYSPSALSDNYQLDCETIMKLPC